MDSAFLVSRFVLTSLGLRQSLADVPLSFSETNFVARALPDLGEVVCKQGKVLFRPSPVGWISPAKR